MSETRDLTRLIEGFRLYCVVKETNLLYDHSIIAATSEIGDISH